MVSWIEVYFHEKMTRVDSFCFCMYRILVVIDEMVIVVKEAY